MFFCQVCGCDNHNEIQCIQCGENPYSQRKYCSNCGSKINGNYEVCPFCESSLIEGVESKRNQNNAKVEVDKLPESYIENLKIKHSPVLITTTDSLSGYKIEKYFGLVSCKVVVGTSFFKDLSAGITDMFGGRSKTFESELSKLENQALEKIKLDTKNLGGNAILGFRSDVDEISGKGMQMFMISMYGTAVLISQEEI